MEKWLNMGISNNRGLMRMRMMFILCFEMIFMQPGYILPFVALMTHDFYSVEKKWLKMRWAHEPHAGKRICLRKRDQSYINYCQSFCPRDFGIPNFHTFPKCRCFLSEVKTKYYQLLSKTVWSAYFTLVSMVSQCHLQKHCFTVAESFRPRTRTVQRVFPLSIFAHLPS